MDQFWKFIEVNRNADPSHLRLKYHDKDMGFDVDFAITQIECRQRFGKKLATTLSLYPHWLFPSVLSGEQSTSDALAKYHATLVQHSRSIIDLTAGLGIDVMHFSNISDRVTAIEIDKHKADILRENISNAHIGNVNVIDSDCRFYLQNYRGEKIDATFIDPARRGDSGERIFALSQCQPNVIEMLPTIRDISERLVIKMSPMMDITAVGNELEGVTKIIALGIPTECKELIAICEWSNAKAEDTVIEAVTIKPDNTIQVFAFTREEEVGNKKGVDTTIPSEGQYLYEPYPTVMKAAPFNTLSQRYPIYKIAPNTQLYFSNKEIPDFPGDVFRIEKIIPYASKHIKRFSKEYPRINVSTRNFDMTAAELRNKLKVKDGGDKRLYAVTLSNANKAMLILSKIKK